MNDCIIISSLPKSEQLPFKAWLAGSTCPIIDDVVIHDTAYKYDYDRWKDASNKLEIYGSMKHEGSLF